MMGSLSGDCGGSPEGFGLHRVGHRNQTDHGSPNSRRTVWLQWPVVPYGYLGITCHK
jgi:hypothetical protein